MADFEKPFIRVKDKRTKHQFDIHRSRFDPEKHELVTSGPMAGDTWQPRRAKPNLRIARSTKASDDPSEQGASPDTESVGENKEIQNG